MSRSDHIGSFRGVTPLRVICGGVFWEYGQSLQDGLLLVDTVAGEVGDMRGGVRIQFDRTVSNRMWSLGRYRRHPWGDGWTGLVRAVRMDDLGVLTFFT